MQATLRITADPVLCAGPAHISSNNSGSLPLADQETIEVLLDALENDNSDAWARALSALREGEYLGAVEDSEHDTTPALAHVISYFSAKTLWHVRKEHKRVKGANDAELERIRLEAEEAAADAAKEDAE